MVVRRIGGVALHAIGQAAVNGCGSGPALGGMAVGTLAGEVVGRGIVFVAVGAGVQIAVGKIPRNRGVAGRTLLLVVIRLAVATGAIQIANVVKGRWRPGVGVMANRAVAGKVIGRCVVGVAVGAVVVAHVVKPDIGPRSGGVAQQTAAGVVISQHGVAGLAIG